MISNQVKLYPFHGCMSLDSSAESRATLGLSSVQGTASSDGSLSHQKASLSLLADNGWLKGTLDEPNKVLQRVGQGTLKSEMWR
jgi:hypothetical protein